MKRWRIQWIVSPDEPTHTKAWAEAMSWCNHEHPLWTFYTKNGARKEAERLLYTLRRLPHTAAAADRYIRYRIVRAR